MPKDGVTVKLEGIPELVKKLEAMGQEMAAKNLVAGAFNASKPVVDAIKAEIEANGSVETGLLRDSISRKRIVYAKDGTIVIITGVNKSTKGTDKHGNPRVPWRYAHLVEKKKPFMKPAWDRVKGDVANNFIEYLQKKIRKFERG